MMRSRIFHLLRLLVLAGLLLAACQPQPAASKTPRLRITNNSAVAIPGLVVLFPDDRVTFGDVAPGVTTDYVQVPHGVYRYAAYSFEVDGEMVTQPVIDWMGEAPVAGQDFTYVLDYEPNRPLMQRIQLVKATVDQ